MDIKRQQRRIAQISIGASAPRNQGSKGIIDICRDYFENFIYLDEFKRALKSESLYKAHLDNQTDALLANFPPSSRNNWGTARKALNLFFRDVVYNFYLAIHLEMPCDSVENTELLKYMEVPLDKDVATGLIGKNTDLPKWVAIKNLTKESSDKYQEYALSYSDRLKTARVHLDLEFWRRIK